MRKNKLFIVFAALAFMIFTSPVIAATVTYDDFDGTSIDFTKWNQLLYGGFSLTVSGGNLVASGAGGTGSGSLNSPQGNLFAKNLNFSGYDGAWISYSGYASSNTAVPPGTAGLYLALGTYSTSDPSLNDYYMLCRATNAGGNWIFASHVTGTTTTVLRSISNGGDSGYLGMFLSEGGALTFSYSGSADSPSWQTLFTTTGSAGLNNPTLGIGVAAGGNGTTYANIGGVYLNPVPIPPAVWLLGSGLVGIIGIRRKRRNG